MSSVLPARDLCKYTSCYCEENIWHLCDQVRRKNPACLQHCYAVFISNESKLTPLWKQTAAKEDDDDGFVLWDYHVIFVYRSQDGLEVYDLDTKLPFPVPLARYVKEGLHFEADFKPEFKRKFRVVPALEMITHFASDRRHMRDEDGKWMKTPPSEATIKTAKSENNLDVFLVMDTKSPSYGRLMDINQFVKM